MDNNYKWCAALSYIFFGLVWFVLDPTVRKNNFVKYHVHYAFWLWISAIILQLVAVFLFAFFYLWILVAIALFVFSLLGVIIALEGKKISPFKI